MLPRQLAIKVLNAALSTGGDYAEIYVEQKRFSAVGLDNGKVESVGGALGFGAGIRILKGFASVYGYTSDLSPKSMLELATKLAASYKGERLIEVKTIKHIKVKNKHKIVNSVMDIPLEEKISYLKECYNITKAVDERLVRIIDSLSNYHTDVEIFNAEGPEALPGGVRHAGRRRAGPFQGLFR